MGWKIPEIKIRVPEVRVPKAPSARVMPKPRAVGPASGKMGWFSLTVFSSNRGPKGIKRIDIIRALIETGGNRATAAKKLGINSGTVSQHAKNIRQMPDAGLQKYAGELNTTVDEIKRVCADFTRTKGVTHIDVIRALLASGGNRKTAAQSLIIKHSAISTHAKNIRQMPDAELQKYAGELNTTVDEIKRVCADFNPAKGIGHIDIMRALLSSEGNRRYAARNLGIDTGVVSQRAKNISRLPDMELKKYADTLSEELKTKITINDIRDVAAPRKIRKINFERRIQVIRELLASGGDRIAAAQNLGIAANNVSHHAKNIRQMPDAQLQICANRLNTAVNEIRRVCADFNAQKGIKQVDIIRELIASGGNKTIVAQNLKIAVSVVRWHAKNISQLPYADLQKYAEELKTTVSEIKRVCADFDISKKITHMDALRALIASDGNRIAAGRSLKIHPSAAGHHAKKIRQMPDAELQKYAGELNTTADEIKRVCADLNPKKGVTHIEAIEALLAANGNKTAAAQNLKITSTVVCSHAQNIMRSPEAKLAQYAVELGVSVERIREVCAPRLEQAKKLFEK